MLSIFKNVIFIGLLSSFSDAADTTCEESEKHFANLCFSPKPTMDIDIEWVQKAQPEDGWHLEMTNDVARLHLAELLYGKLLTLQDTFVEEPCFRSKLEHGDGVAKLIDGTFYGFGNSTAKWACNASLDSPGVLRCDMSASGLSKYHEDVNIYTTYSDNKNLQIGILCFPNGQVGWMAVSVSQTLSDEENKLVNEHIKSLGFSEENTVTTYNEKCTNEP